MGYTALDRMRAHNLEKYRLDSPAVPALEAGDENSLAWCALTFLRENCEDLRFDPIPLKLPGNLGKRHKSVSFLVGAAVYQ